MYSESQSLIIKINICGYFGGKKWRENKDLLLIIFHQL